MILIKTSKGNIKLKLDTKNTPITANNFLSYVRSDFYKDTIFHRVINGFMIQGGGLTEALETKKTNPPIKNEAKKAQKNKKGTIAMARTMDKDSATAQFFINLVDNAFLNYSNDSAQGAGYCVFGEVVEGMDVVDSIAKVKTGQKKDHADVPLEAIMINEITEI
ncbi:MAG: peptidylprolyl isomerase [Legionellales bacterium RIFCSPHIGHO2_12_FULL_37_14]|nr:MAG: peptidylprolyl isomerase [Legionellales bacterium RIFCSPHIGHO2_12_FULL_37_14]